MDGGNAIWCALMGGSVHRGLASLPLVVLGMLLLFACAEGTYAQRHRDPCRLVSDTEMRAVQGQAPAQKIPSEQPAGAFQFTQCFYRTPDVASSLSVAVGIPVATDSKRSGPRNYWQAQFNRPVKSAPGRKKKEPPMPVAGLGDEAFWVGDPVTGALYVMKGEVFLRVSVGGPPDQTGKIKRAKALASHALKRLDTSGPGTRSR